MVLKAALEINMWCIAHKTLALILWPLVSKNLIRLGSLIDFSLELSLKFAIFISSAH